ncbi:hypothetical protein ACFL4G_04970 [Thermodesulfobacteriota bacterium]
MHWNRLSLTGCVLSIFFIVIFAGCNWSKTYGGAGYEGLFSVQQTTDGGYIAAGSIIPFWADYSYFYLIKTNALGIRQWTRTLGGARNDEARSVQQTADGGYIGAGSTSSYGAGSYDFYLVKTSALGVRQWDKTFGGANSDKAYSVQQTTDGGYIVAGYTKSYGAGNFDFYLVKTDASGNMLWDKTFGGIDVEVAFSVRQTTDGGYIVAGRTESYGAGDSDIYLIKTDASGSMLWDKTFGDGGGDWASSVQQTTDGGYIVAGTIDIGWMSAQAWLIKTDACGNMLWDKTFSHNIADEARSVQQTRDGGYILAASTWEIATPLPDIWLIKTDARGNMRWDKIFGDFHYGHEIAYSVQQTMDGGFILAGEYFHYDHYEKMADAWLIKTDWLGNAPPSP